jgi:hypothetical protein
MKSILKNINPKLDLDYDETFISERNTKIRRSLVKELRKDLAPQFRPSVGQLTSWLSCLHKSRRTQRKIKKDGKFGEDKRRVQDVSNSTEFIPISHLYTKLIFWYLEKNTTSKGR